jgi:murein tripeptide amidase MpaA
MRKNGKRGEITKDGKREKIGKSRKISKDGPGEADALRLRRVTGALRLLLLLLIATASFAPFTTLQGGDGGRKEKGEEERPKGGTERKETAWKRRNSGDTLDFKHYCTYGELTRILKGLRNRHPRLARLRSMGKSFEGRDLWIMELWDAETGPPETKAAMYIDGNAHGNEILGTEVCLYTIDFLLRCYGKDPYVTRLLKERVFYIAPCVNPDGRAAFLRDPGPQRGCRFNRRPRDDDRDGLVDEDGFEDLDGDGEILMMRKADPMGRWVEGDDPRILLPRDPDRPGMWRLWFTEGIDNDGDGRYNEDPPGGVDLNRNYPANWRPEHVQRGAGDYPLSEPESRAVALYILDRPHIAAIQSYHTMGGMILRPPASKDDRGVPRRDLRMYHALGRRGERTLPGYRYLQTCLGLYRLYGGFLEWGYMGLGVYTFTNELWQHQQDYDGDGRVDPKERLRWSDEMLQGEGFRPWRPFRHPQLGAVEIGGWRKFSTQLPPGWAMEEICHRNCRFTLYHAEMMPKVMIAEVHCRRIGGKAPSAGAKTFSVTARLVNEGFMDTATGQAEILRAIQPDTAELHAPEAEVLSAEVRFEEGVKRRIPERRPGRLILGHLRGRSRVEVTWLVRGRGKARIVLTSPRGGRVARTIRLRDEGPAGKR